MRDLSSLSYFGGTASTDCYEGYKGMYCKVG